MLIIKQQFRETVVDHNFHPLLSTNKQTTNLIKKTGVPALISSSGIKPFGRRRLNILN